MVAYIIDGADDKWTYDLPHGSEWQRDNKMSGSIQNAILEILTHAVHREIVSEVKGCTCF